MTWLQKNSYDWGTNTWQPSLPKEAKEGQREYLGEWAKPDSPENFFGVARGMAGPTEASFAEMYKKPYNYWTYSNELQWSIFTLQWPMIFNAALIGKE